MEMSNSNPNETLVSDKGLAGSVSETSTPKASPSTGGLGAEALVSETSPVLETVAAPAAIIPEATPVLVTAAVTPAPVPAVKATATVAPVPAVKMELPKTTGQTVGGWNRFAGYNPNAAKNKPKDGRGGPGRK